MKLVLYNDYRPGLLKGDSVVDLEAIVSRLGVQTGQEAMEAIITQIDDLGDELSRLERESEGVPLSTVALRPPLATYEVGGGQEIVQECCCPCFS